MQLLNHQYDFSGIDITLLKVVDYLLVINVLSKSHPAGIDIELLELVLEISTLIDFHKEYILGLLDPTKTQEGLDLVLRGYFH